MISRKILSAISKMGGVDNYIKYMLKELETSLAYNQDERIRENGLILKANLLSSYFGDKTLSPLLQPGQAVSKDAVEHLKFIMMSYDVEVISYESSKTPNPVKIPNPVFNLIDELVIAEKELKAKHKKNPNEKFTEEREHIKQLTKQVSFYESQKNIRDRKMKGKDKNGVEGKMEMHRRIGIDMTYSCGKDVSALWALHPERREWITQIFHESNVVALTDMQNNARGMYKGKMYKCEIGVVSYFHCDSRSVEDSKGNLLDPDFGIHLHNIIQPTGRLLNDDGTPLLNEKGEFVRVAIDLNSIVQKQKESDLKGRHHLAKKLQEGGIELEVMGSGDVKVSQVCDRYVNHFSKRATKADKEAEETGKSKSLCVEKTKLSKDDTRTFTSMEESWIKQANELALNPKQLRLNPENIEKFIFRKDDQGKPLATDYEAIHKIREPLLTRLGAERAVSGMTAKFTEQALREHYIKNVIGTKYSVEDAIALFESHIQEIKDNKYDFHEMVKIGGKGVMVEQFTCEYALNLVNDIVELTKHSKLNKFEHPITKLDILTAISDFETKKGFPLTSCQRVALTGMLECKDRIIYINGAAGTGKSTTSLLSAELFESYKNIDGTPQFDMHYLGSTHGAKDVLADDLEGRLTNTAAKLVQQIQEGSKQLKSNSIIFLDEACMTSAESIRDLLLEADKVGARIIMGGDVNQLKSVGFTSPVGLMVDVIKDTSVFRLQTVMRQETDDLLEVAEMLKNDFVDKKKQLSTINKMIRLKWLVGKETDDEARSTLVEQFMSCDLPIEQKLVLTPENRDVRLLNEAIQKEMQSGKSNHFVEVDTYSKDRVKNDRQHTIRVYEGERVVILENENQKTLLGGKKGGIQNGNIGYVRNIQDKKFDIVFYTKKGDVLKVVKCDADRPETIPKAFDLAYAGTTNFGQGKTVKQMFGFVREGLSELDKNNFYVMLSRMRTGISIFCTNNTIERIKAIKEQVKPKEMYEMVATEERFDEAYKAGDVKWGKMIAKYNHALHDTIMKTEHYVNKEPAYIAFIEKVLDNAVVKKDFKAEPVAIKMEKLEKIQDCGFKTIGRFNDKDNYLSTIIENFKKNIVVAVEQVKAIVKPIRLEPSISVKAMERGNQVERGNRVERGDQVERGIKTAKLTVLKVSEKVWIKPTQLVEPVKVKVEHVIKNESVVNGLNEILAKAMAKVEANKTAYVEKFTTQTITPTMSLKEQSEAAIAKKNAELEAKEELRKAEKIAQAKIEADRIAQEQAKQAAEQASKDNVLDKIEEQLGNNELHTALKKGDIDEAIKLIEEDGGLLEERNKAGDKPLWIADVKAVSKTTGNTALHIAAAVGDTDDVLSLIRRGADKTLLNKSGLAPIDFNLDMFRKIAAKELQK